MDLENLNLKRLTREELEKVAMILNLKKLDEDIRLAREKAALDRERYEREREEEKRRYEAEMVLRRERHERELAKIRAESDKMHEERRKLRLEWLLYPLMSAAASAGAVAAVLKMWSP